MQSVFEPEQFSGFTPQQFKIQLHQFQESRMRAIQYAHQIGQINQQQFQQEVQALNDTIRQNYQNYVNQIGQHQSRIGQQSSGGDAGGAGGGGGQGRIRYPPGISMHQQQMMRMLYQQQQPEIPYSIENSSENIRISESERMQISGGPSEARNGEESGPGQPAGTLSHFPVPLGVTQEDHQHFKSQLHKFQESRMRAIQYVYQIGQINQQQFQQEVQALNNKIRQGYQNYVDQISQQKAITTK